MEYSYEDKLLEQGHCYVITSQPVVAKTADGQYFRSVKAAFDNAEDLYDDGKYTTVETNYVKLLRPFINGLKEDMAHDSEGSYSATTIEIDYPVTFDLNGCLLSLDCCEDEDDDLYLCRFDSFYSGGFNVNAEGTLTVIDSGESGCIDSGSEDCPIITSSGTVNILGGSLSHLERCQAIKSTEGTVNMQGGELYAWGSPALFLTGSSTTGNIFGGYIGNNDDSLAEAIQIFAGADCTISGGIIYSKGNSATIGCRSVETDGKQSTLTVTWPESPDTEEMSPMEYGQTIKEPLIYAAVPGAETYSLYGCAPICAHYSNNSGTFNNTAVVKILGGYLISNSGWFYAGDGLADYDFNIDHESFGCFYSNQKQINKNGSTNALVDLDNGGSGSKISTKTNYPTFKAYFQENSGFTMPEIVESKSTGDLWFITKKETL